MTRLFTIIAVLGLSSVASVAQACQMHNHEQAMSCAEGSVYDAESETCVPLVAS